MKKLKATLWVAVCVAALVMSAGKVQAQGRGNVDPAQRRQERIDALRDKLDVKDDAEWKLIEAAIGKVYDAGREVMGVRMRAMTGGRNRGGNNGGDTTGGNNNRGRGGFFGSTPSPEYEDLQKAIDDKAPADVIKAKLAKLREADAAVEAKLTQAQDELKGMLTSRQEAVAVLNGLLK